MRKSKKEKDLTKYILYYRMQFYSVWSRRFSNEIRRLHYSSSNSILEREIMIPVSITNGPSKFDLMQALFVRKPTRPTVTFIVSQDNAVQVFIDLVEAEDASGESWNIKGSVGNNKKFLAYYQTDKRTGRYQASD
jgi:hypothetical protein